MPNTPFSVRPDYDRFVAQEAQYFPSASRAAVERLIDSSLPEETQWVARDRDGYPDELNIVPRSPDVLVYEGNLPLLSRQVRLAVAGSREAPPERVQTTNELASALTEDRVALLSGMISDIDEAVHLGSLATRQSSEHVTLSTAMVTSPFGAPWPLGRHNLARKLVRAGGLVLSLTPQLRGLSLSESERLAVVKYRQLIEVTLSSAILIMYVHDGGFTTKLVQEAITLERPVLLWHEILNDGSQDVQTWLSNNPKDRTGRELFVVVHNVEEIHQAISAWQNVWWL